VAVVARNSAEGGTNGTTVTTGNSGGASGTAWSSVVSTNSTNVFDNTSPAHGTMGYKQATAATSAQALLSWTSGVIGSLSRGWIRWYLVPDSFSAARSILRTRASGTQVMRLQISTAGKIEIRQTANNVVATTTAAMSAGTRYRIEVDCRPGSSQTNTIRLYQGDSPSLIEELQGTGDFSSSTTWDEVNFGNAAAGSNLPINYLDDMIVRDDTWPGPYVARPCIVVSRPAGVRSAAW